MEMHFATVWEAIAEAIPEHPALVHGDLTRTWAEYDARASRLAAAFHAAGIGHNAKVGMYLYNGPEYLETQYAAFKVRATPVNVNYRYLDDELWYLLDNADAEALVFHTSLADRVERVKARLPKVRLYIQVDDGGSPIDAAHYEALIDGHAPMAPIMRDESDLYMLYTGGTTGMPKGVMYAMGGMTDSFVQGFYPLVGLTPPANAHEIPTLVKSVAEAGNAPISIPTCPLMHGTGMWLGALVPHLLGGAVITMTAKSLDGDEVLRAVQQHNVGFVTVVGDAMCKPIIRSIDDAIERGEPYDLSSLKMMISSGVMWTAEVKNDMLDRVPQIVLLDAIGSTEGSMGSQISMKGVPAQTAKFAQTPHTKVFTEDGREVVPGSDETGMVAAGGNVPLGYYKDEEKSARTFRVINGVRYSFPGDWATVNADGTITLLGRGSQCINTGGEKVFPEEVEEAVKRVDGVEDCLVVGMPDEKFGQAVTAVVSLLAEGPSPDAAAIIAGVKAQLSAFKAPKRVVIVATVPRAPNGKADYKAATVLATPNL
jgi:3-oxocholest-4-en-26-oate---CoA ligase